MLADRRSLAVNFFVPTITSHPSRSDGPNNNERQAQLRTAEANTFATTITTTSHQDVINQVVRLSSAAGGGNDDDHADGRFRYVRRRFYCDANAIRQQS